MLKGWSILRQLTVTGNMARIYLFLTSTESYIRYK